MKLFQKQPVIFSFLLILTWQFLLLFQGVDLADTGFHLSAFTFFFEDPYSIQYSMSFWLSGLTGHFWMEIWPSGGLFWARIGWVFVISLSLMIYFTLLKPELGVQKTLVGLGITTIFILQGGPECLNYDMFSILGYGLTVLLLYKGLCCNKYFHLFLSGLILGITVFFKLTNLSGLLLFLLLPISSYYKKEKFIKLVKNSAIFISGFIIGLSFILLLIKTTGQLDLFLDNLAFISNMTKDGTASHGFIPLLKSYLSGYLNAGVLFLGAATAIWFCGRFLTGLFKHPSNKYTWALYIIIAGVCVVLMLIFERVFWSKIRYFFIGLMVFAAIYNSLDKSSSYKTKLLLLTGLLLLLIAPLGSDSGLEKSVFGMWILGPVVLTNLDINRYFRKTNIFFSKLQVKLLQKSLAIIVFTASVLLAWQNTYFDTGSRLQKSHSIDHPKMKYVFTSKERANSINELIKEGFIKIKDEEYLLSFIEMPMLNYLSNKKPYLSTSWPKLYYNPKAFEMKLDEALKRRNKLPAIIRQKQNTMLDVWPLKQANPIYLNYPKGLSKWPEHGKLLNLFIKKYKYKVIWENEMFQVLVD